MRKVGLCDGPLFTRAVLIDWMATGLNFRDTVQALKRLKILDWLYSPFGGCLPSEVLTLNVCISVYVFF